MEKCSYCDIALRLQEGKMQVEGDDSPDTATRVFLMQTQVCANPQCPRYGQVADVLRQELMVG